MDMLKISGLRKSFGPNEILKDVSFTVPEHSVFGFIGKNGAGKTTTMKIILGLLKADAGEIYVNGEKAAYGQNSTNRYIGYLPDVPEFYGFMTPTEYLHMCGEITGMDKKVIREVTEKLLNDVGLGSYNKRIQGFSRGMKQRLGIAQALLNSPKLLICDEPTSALDPVGRKEILDLIRKVTEQTTVIFSTHILSDVERICDRAAFLHNGKIMLCGTTGDIRAARGDGQIEIEFEQADDAAGFAANYRSASVENGGRVVISGDEADMGKLLAALSQGGYKVHRVEVLEPTLEELFMEVMEQ